MPAVSGFTAPALLRKYGVATTLYFFLVDVTTDDFDNGAVFASGDVKVSKDGAAFGNASNGFTAVGNGLYALLLTAAEMEAEQVVVMVVDQGSKSWDDLGILIDTYGDADALHPFDMSSATVSVGAVDSAGGIAIADAILKRDFSAITGEAARSALNALRFLRNRWTLGATTLVVYEEDDATQAWAATVTTSENDPVSGIDPS